MNLMVLISLLFDGAQVVVENIKIISILSANIIGIGAFGFWGMSACRANVEWGRKGVALLSLGISGFVLVSYAIVALSSIWPMALPILSNALLTVALLTIVTGLLRSIKKKPSAFHSDVSLSHSPFLR